jgi:DNA-binding NarL/FixJ family response regulator
MTCLRALLVTNDPLLLGSIREALDQLGQVQIEVVASCAEAAYCLEVLEPALLLIHIATPAQVDAAERLLGQLATSRRQIPTLVVTELELAERCLRLLQMGAADCLPRPLDLPRLAYLADLLTARHRFAPGLQSLAEVRYSTAPKGGCWHVGCAYLRLAEDAF